MPEPVDRTSPIDSSLTPETAVLVLSGEHLSDPLIQLDRHWRIVEVNPAAADLLGRSPGALLQQDLWQSLPQWLESPVFPALHQAVDEGRTVEVESRFPGREETWFVLRALPHPRGLLILGRDVTETRRQNQQHRQRFSRHEQWLAALSDGILALDPDGVIAYANPAASRMLGCGNPWLMGKPLETLLLANPQETREPIPCLTTLEKQPQQPHPALLRRADGSALPVELVFCPLSANQAPISPGSAASGPAGSRSLQAGAITGPGGVLLLRCRKNQNQVRDLLEKSRSFLRGVFDTMGSHLCILDHNGTIIDVNQAWCDHARENQHPDPACGLGGNYLALCETLGGTGHPKSKEIAAALHEILEGKRQNYELEYPCRTPARQQWFVMCAHRLVHEGQVFVVVAHHDITLRKLAEIQSRHDSLHDALTGLPNRVRFQERLLHRVKRSRIDDDYNYAVLFIDLDNFKKINDSLGHGAGDQLLKQVSGHLYESLRKSLEELGLPEHSLVLARQGGDEFMVLLEQVDSMATLRMIVARLQPEGGLRFQIDGHEVVTSASIGVVQGNPRYDTPEALVRDGDIAMYRAKAHGRGRYEIFDQAMHVQITQRLQLENELRIAVERRELELCYQPIYALETGQVLGLEALVRWQRRDGTYVPSVELIPLAEESDLIVPLGKWVVEEACRRLGQWSRTAPTARNLGIHVNLSRRQLCAQDDLVQFVEKAISSSDIRASQLHLEIAENAIMTNPDAARVQFQLLRALGVKIDIDDFGSGYSSLNYLHRLPLDGLKIDRTFVANLVRQRDYSAIIQAIITLAHNLNMRVVAEGIETHDQLVQLQALECDAGQGFFFTEPLAVEGVRKLLSANFSRVA